MTKPVAPTVPPPALRSQPDTFSDRAEVNVSFWPTLTAYMSDVVNYTEEQANALLTGNLPDLTGKAGNVLQVNGSEDGVSLFGATAVGYDMLGAVNVDAQLDHLGLDVSGDVTDWHALTRPGIYSGNNAANAPGSGRYHGFLSYVSATNQLLFVINRDNGEAYWASKTGSSWDAWQPFGRSKWPAPDFSAVSTDWLNNGVTVFPHGLGAPPGNVRPFFECKVAINGYAVGEQVRHSFGLGSSFGAQVSWDATNITYNAATPALYAKGSTSQFQPTNVNFNLHMEAWA